MKKFWTLALLLLSSLAITACTSNKAGNSQPEAQGSSGSSETQVTEEFIELGACGVNGNSSDDAGCGLPPEVEEILTSAESNGK